MRVVLVLTSVATAALFSWWLETGLRETLLIFGVILANMVIALGATPAESATQVFTVWRPRYLFLSVSAICVAMLGTFLVMWVPVLWTFIGCMMFYGAIVAYEMRRGSEASPQSGTEKAQADKGGAEQ